MTEKRSRKISTWPLLLVVAASLLVGAALGAALGPLVATALRGPDRSTDRLHVDVNKQAGKTRSRTAKTAGSPALGATSADAQRAIKAALPWVVSVGPTTGDAAAGTGVFSLGAGPAAVVGAGIIYREDGYVLTNLHVVQGSREVMVGFADGSRDKARLVASDPDTDLALLVASRRGLPAAKFSTDEVTVGEPVVALGSPGGLERTASQGIVGTVHRTAWIAPSRASPQGHFFADLIETDAGIYPGSSGGPLLNGRGEMVGINTLIAQAASASSGIGFAIPADTVREVADSLFAGKAYVQPYIGVLAMTLDPSVARGFGHAATKGALVFRVVPESPAGHSGIHEGDFLISADGRPMSGADDLLRALRRHAIGESVDLKLVRNGKELTISVPVARRPSSF